MVAHLEKEVKRGLSAWSGLAFRRTVVWQLMVSLALAAVAAFVAGWHGFWSAMLGGGIGIIGVLVFVLVAGCVQGDSRNVIRIALRAEAVKILVIVALLWLVFIAYRDMVVLVFMGAFVVSVLLSGLVFAVSGNNQLTSNSC
jgi:ATP synthase protein I